jgi:hypothetical protein
MDTFIFKADHNTAEILAKIAKQISPVVANQITRDRLNVIADKIAEQAELSRCNKLTPAIDRIAAMGWAKSKSGD